MICLVFYVVFMLWPMWFSISYCVLFGVRVWGLFRVMFGVPFGVYVVFELVFDLGFDLVFYLVFCLMF